MGTEQQPRGGTTSASGAHTPTFEPRKLACGISHHAAMQTSDGDKITIARGIHDVPPVMLAVAGDGSAFSFWMTEDEAAATGRELLKASGMADPEAEIARLQSVNAQLLEALQTITLACCIDRRQGIASHGADTSVIDAAAAAIAAATGEAA